MTRPDKFSADGKVWCMGCQAYLTRFKFGGWNSTRPPARCKKCRSKANHAKRIEATYGLTAEAYAVLLDFQNGVCAICLRPSHVRRLAVDHDHQTGMVRGLLCRHCNYELLGWYKDDEHALQRAIDYLREPPLVRIVRGRIGHD